MNISSNNKSTTVVSFRDIIWDLLSQWKAVLIVALIMAMLTSGAKYYKDINRYKDNLENSKNEQTSELPLDVQIDNILSALPEGDREAVEYMVQQQDWVNLMKDYINNSIYMKVDPVSQRTAVLDYYIDSHENDDSVLATLVYAYSSYASSEKIIEGIRDVIDPDIDSKYVSELVYAPVENLHFDNGDAVLEVKIVIEEDTDANAIEKVITDAFTEYSKELNKTICTHTVSLIRSDVTHFFNSYALNNRNSITSNIFSIQNNYIKNMETSLSDGQKAAFHAIVELKAAAAQSEEITDQAAEDKDDAETNEPAKPGISKKHTMLGFVLGVMLYAFLYALYTVFKGRITSAGQTVYYTGNRLIGEVYSDTEHAGSEKIFHSKLVDRFRYRGKLDADKQTEKAVSSLEAVCKHAQTEDITLLCLPGVRDGDEKVLNSIASAAKDKGVNIEIFNIGEEIDENQLVEVKNSVIVAGDDSRAIDMISLSQLCRDYELGQLGNIYLKNI